MPRQEQFQDDEKPSPSVTLTFAELKELLASNRPSQDEQIALMEKQAEITAKAHQKLARPENPQHPGKGVFAYPEGELARPKPALRCKTTWGGSDVQAELLTPQEIELFNQVQPGSFKIERPDNSHFMVDVEPTINRSSGKFERLDIVFTTRGHARHNLPSMVSMLRDMVAQAQGSVASTVG